MDIHDANFDFMRRQVAAGAVGRCKRLASGMLGRCFPEQKDFILDVARFKSLLCPRRAGKTHAICVYILYAMMMIPGARVIYIARTRDKAREILWDQLKQMARDFETNVKFSEVYTSGVAPNGSYVRLRGCETVADANAFVGEKFHLVIIDEGSTHPPHVLDYMIDKALLATLGDYKGTLVLAGTPNTVLAGRFYKASGSPAFEIKEYVNRDTGAPYLKSYSRPFADRDRSTWANVRFGWSAHAWNVKANTAMPHMWDEFLAIKELNEWADDNPYWLTEYMGRWAAGSGNLVYHAFSPEVNTWDPPDEIPAFQRIEMFRDAGQAAKYGLPVGHRWRCVLGMDFGTKDPFAMSVMAWSETCKSIYQLYEYVSRKPGPSTDGIPGTGIMLPPAVAEKVNEVCAAFPIESMICDFGPYGEYLQLQLAQEYGLAIGAAEKKLKRDHIDLLNADFHAVRCFLLRDSEAARQMMINIWDDTGLKEKNQRNDACDAVVYTWRLVQHHYSVDPPAAIVKGSPEAEKLREEAELAHLVAQELRQSNPQAEGGDFADGYDQDNEESGDGESWM